MAEEHSTAGLAILSWTLWGGAVFFVAARLVSRYMTFGSLRKFEIEDYLAVAALGCHLGVVFTTNEVAANGSNYVHEEVIKTWGSEQVGRAVWGSKMLVALEQTMLGCLWLVKACLLRLYARMTTGTPSGLLVKIVAVYCLLGYIVIQGLYLGYWCQPLPLYWAVPVPPGHEQCTSYRAHMATTTVFNISSDLAMLCIPLPLILRAHLPPRRKLVLCALFSAGLVTVAVAILNRYYNFTTSNDLVFLGWYNGEAAAAMIVSSLPYGWNLLRSVFRLGSWNGSRDTGAGGGGGGGGGGRSGRPHQVAASDIPPTIGGSGARRLPGGVATVDLFESEENLTTLDGGESAFLREPKEAHTQEDRWELRPYDTASQSERS